MDPPAELPLKSTHEELARGKINWLPEEENSRERGDVLDDGKGEKANDGKQVKMKK